jgi:hypothetical protein
MSDEVVTVTDDEYRELLLKALGADGDPRDPAHAYTINYLEKTVVAYGKALPIVRRVHDEYADPADVPVPPPVIPNTNPDDSYVA